MALLPFLIVFMLTFAVGESAVTNVLADAVPVVSVSRVEVVLAYQYRTREAEIKKDFAQAGLTNVQVQYARMGQPPQNIGMGRDVPGDKAREAIRLAMKSIWESVFYSLNDCFLLGSSRLRRLTMMTPLNIILRRTRFQNSRIRR